MNENDYDLRLARARFDELLEARQRTRRPGPRRGRAALAKGLHRFADQLENQAHR